MKKTKLLENVLLVWLKFIKPLILGTAILCGVCAALYGIYLYVTFRWYMAPLACLLAAAYGLGYYILYRVCEEGKGGKGGTHWDC